MRGYRLCLSAWLLAGTTVACMPTAPSRHAEDPEAVAQEELRQKRETVRTRVEQMSRLQTVAFPLLVAAAPLCGSQTAYDVGFALTSLEAWPRDLREAAEAELGPSADSVVYGVAPGSHASRAGVRDGDRIVTVNRRRIASAGPEEAGAMLDEAVRWGRVVEIGLESGTGRRTVSVRPQFACNYLVRLVESERINAGADGKNLYVTTGTTRFLASDEELAVIVAHELVHNAMQHAPVDGFPDAVLDTAIRMPLMGITPAVVTTVAQALLSEGYETEADQVGAYVMAMAGMSVEGLPELWRTMALEFPDQIETGCLATHPSSAERFLALEQTVAEIQEAQAAGEFSWPESLDVRARLLQQRSREYDVAAGRTVILESGPRVTLNGGCWRPIGEIRRGIVYRPDDGKLEIEGREAGLVIADGELTGVLLLRRQRFLALDRSRAMDEFADLTRYCD